MDEEEVKNLLSALIASAPTPYYIKDLLYDFKKEFGCNLPIFGHKSSLEFLKSMPDVIKLTGCDPLVQVKLVENSKSGHICSLVKRQNIKKSKKSKYDLSKTIVRTIFDTVPVNKKGDYQNENFQTRQNLNDVISSNEYYETQNLYLNSNNSNSVNNTVDITYSNPQLKIPRNKNSPQNETENEEHIENELIKNQKTSTELQVIDKMTIITLSKEVEQTVNIDTNIITNIYDIPKLDLKSHATIGEYVEVYVTKVHTPHTFNLQLRKFRLKLTNLIIQLQSFYNQDIKDYEIPNDLIKADLVCAVLYETNNKCAEWHRSVILELLDYSVVLVKLVDIGTILEVKSKNLRFLHRQFGQFPVQALKGHLAYLKPFRGNIWSSKTNKRFEDLVLDKDLIAGVVDLNYKDLWLSVALSNTNGTEIHISDTLVEENLAVFEINEFFSEYFSSMNRTFEGDNYENQYPYVQNSFISQNIWKPQKSRSKEKISETLKYSENNVKLKELFMNYYQSQIKVARISDN